MSNPPGVPNINIFRMSRYRNSRIIDQQEISSISSSISLSRITSCPILHGLISHPYSLPTALMTSAPPPLTPMSPMVMSPVGPLSPPRPISPPRYPSSPPKRVTPKRELSPLPPALNHPLPSACSPTNPVAVGQPSSPAEAPQSSGSASSSSDSGSDSGSDSSDDSEDEDDLASAPPPSKGPTTPPSISPKQEPLEEPPPAVEERRWDLSSFFNKSTVQHGEQNSESKPAQVRSSTLIKVKRYFDNQ